jgi:hypothetical protein
MGEGERKRGKGPVKQLLLFYHKLTSQLLAHFYMISLFPIFFEEKKKGKKREGV